MFYVIKQKRGAQNDELC